MRPALLAWALSSLLLVSAAKDEKVAVSLDEAIKGDTVAKTQKVDFTVFNGVDVPPMPELQGDNFGETIKDGYW